MTARDVLFEVRTEELPPRTLPALSNALTEGIVKGLDAAGVAHGAAHGFATPRRLAVKIASCAEFAPDRRVERRGPPVAASFDAQGEPTQAAAAFAKSCGVAVGSLERLTTDKGSWLAYRGTEPGAATAGLLNGIVSQAIAGLPIAKRMRWGAHDAEFVRPVRSVILLFGDDVVPVTVLGLHSGRMTAGHRFHAPGPLTVRSPGSYESQLRRSRVIADFGKRRAAIRAGVMAAAAESGGTALIEDALLDEVTALVEWPVPIAGRFEQRFLALPREVVIATVQDHQRYFPVEGADGSLSRVFITVSNIQSRDPAVVREGNERVVRPRLSDAAFFWDQDRKVPLEAHAARLGEVTFQTRLGSYAQKSLRVRALTQYMAGRISASSSDAARAAELAKADLMTAMVGEFPELQGTMGKYYALAQGEPAELAQAIEEHYRPRYAGDVLPKTKIGQALALADKVDTLVGIFAIEQRPTGTKDPFGLRRAALGVLRIILEGGLDLDLPDLLKESESAQPIHRPGVVDEVYDFIAERLRGLLLERADGTTPEMIDAVLAGRPASPLDVETRLQALKAFLLLPDAGVLTAINKRIANILRKAPHGIASTVQTAALAEEAERALHRVLGELGGTVEMAIAERRYADALRALTGLSGTVDEFFEKIMVMDEDLDRRNNRLALLRNVQVLLGGVADLSRLPG
ncbi:MAG TPA: glycine--tRNA ligase subunit beta [Steroidobacteraceae bacterium]|nr:glycine--tRNA ligase subunit beta [Steroidobacteraceae bacterium]